MRRKVTQRKFYVQSVLVIYCTVWPDGRELAEEAILFPVWTLNVFIALDMALYLGQPSYQAALLFVNLVHKVCSCNGRKLVETWDLGPVIRDWNSSLKVFSDLHLQNALRKFCQFDHDPHYRHGLDEAKEKSRNDNLVSQNSWNFSTPTAVEVWSATKIRKEAGASKTRDVFESRDHTPTDIDIHV